MLALTINNVKYTMNKLLKLRTFDHFQLMEMTFQTPIRYSISGKLSEEENYVFWKDVRHIIYSIIKQSEQVNQFKLVMLQKKEDANFYLQFYYENKELRCTTGISCQDFMKAKDYFATWDQECLLFLQKEQIDAQ